MSTWNPDDVDSDEETLDTIGHTWGLRDGVIYLIEISEKMLEESEGESSHFRTCIDCCLTTMMNRIISSPRDQVAIVLYGTRKSPMPIGSHNFNPASIPVNTSVYMVLQEPSAENIKWLQGVKESPDLKNFQEEYGVSRDFAIGDALEACTYLFRTSEVKLETSTIILFTVNDNPHPNNEHKKQQAIRRALDLSTLRIDLDVIPLSNEFNCDHFYKELICTAMQLDPLCFRMPEPQTTLERLLTRVIKRDHRHKCIVRVKWFLGEDLALTVGVYNICRPTQQPRKIHLERDTNEVVTAVQRYHHVTFNEFNEKVIGEPVPANNLRLSQSFGGADILFLPEEVKAIKRITDPGLKLLGFKPISTLPLEYFLKSSSFIYPIDDILEGSGKLFTALLDRCAARKVMAICTFTPKRNMSVCFVALIPQLEEVGQYELQLKPPGFHLVYLPSAENFRSLNLDGEGRPVHVSDYEKDIMSKIINKLKFKYDPLNIENPKLQTLYSHIEALALDLEQPRNIEDSTLPDLEIQKRLLDNLSEDFKQTFGDDEPPRNSRKRPYTNADSSSSTSKSSIDGNDISQLQQAISDGQANKLTISQLKEFLKHKGVRGITGKNKSALIEMANEHR
ncbi:X-ray repair cross-complementing protein 6 [Ctenocephalides felis]|uniref:X-ray repair cross-complementing protein 6 n=1 Tax=Ctenocephalides felis TaxID=7515 RepID=UPI000E6E2887|nr:X-ray repair cross-complementing protein 6 [Ctenocephalides felis]